MAKKNNKKDKKEKTTVVKNDSVIIELDLTPNEISHKVSEIGLTVFSKKGPLNMSLQFGEGVTWETIRVIQTDSTFPLSTNISRKGDGVKRFRVLVENDNSDDIDFFYWVDSVLISAF